MLTLYFFNFDSLAANLQMYEIFRIILLMFHVFTFSWEDVRKTPDPLSVRK